MGRPFFFNSCVYLIPVMQALSFYTLLILTILTSRVNSQELPNPERQLEKEIQAIAKEDHQKYLIKKAQFHIKQSNYDSAIYYADTRINLDIEIENVEDLIGAYSHKIEILRLQRKYEEALKIGLSTFENYCDVDIKEANCNSCSNLYNELHELSLLMKNNRRALNYLEMQCNKETAWLAYYYKKALIYTQLGLPDSALATTIKCISLRKRQKDGLRLMHAYNNHGLIASQLNLLDTAIWAFEKALAPEQYNARATKLYAVIKGNLGHCYYKKNDYKKAYEYLLLDAEESLKNNILSSFISASIMLAQIDIEEKKYQKAIRRLENLENNYTPELGSIEVLQINELLMQAYQGINNDSKFKFYVEKWTTLNKQLFEEKLTAQQELTDEFHANSLMNAMKNIENEKKLMNQEIVILENINEKDQLKNGLIILSLVLISVVILFFFLRYRIIQSKKSILKQAQLDASDKEQEILALKVKEQKRNVQVLSHELTVKQDFSENLIEELKEVESLSSPELKNIEIFIQNELEVKSARVALQNQMGELSSNFNNELKIKHPSLTDLELKLAGMVVMKMSNKEIGVSKNTTWEAAKKAKNRLKKKLEILPDDDLTDYLTKLL